MKRKTLGKHLIENKMKKYVSLCGVQEEVWLDISWKMPWPVGWNAEWLELWLGMRLRYVVAVYQNYITITYAISSISEFLTLSSSVKVLPVVPEVIKVWEVFCASYSFVGASICNSHRVFLMLYEGD